ncbi:hypothetical protein A2U01_0071878, partial [Trifolium medium]|nr:hypothetical protein [Trifolium medium]
GLDHVITARLKQATTVYELIMAICRGESKEQQGMGSVCNDGMGSVE